MTRRELFAAALAAPLAGAPARWQVRVDSGSSKTTVGFTDVKFASARRGIAVGSVVELRSGLLTSGPRIRHIAMVTNNGGEAWAEVELKQAPVSLYLLDDSVGWLVTPRGLWLTEESGRSWRRVSSQPDLLKVHFLDRQRGFGVGINKTLVRTGDGGQSWKPLPALDGVKTPARNSCFVDIAFPDARHGVIAGWSRSNERPSRLPDWMEPEEMEREKPSISITLESRDGGTTWSSAVASAFGLPVALRLHPDGRSLVLYRFRGAFPLASVLYQFNWQRGGQPGPSLEERDWIVTDVAFGADGAAYAAAVQRVGRLQEAPYAVPVRVLRSTDLRRWEPETVDYRANARRVTLAPAPDGTLWLATDTGQLLQRRP